MHEAYLGERGGGASCAAAPGAKMGSHTNVSDKKLFYALKNFYINESNNWKFNNKKHCDFFCKVTTSCWEQPLRLLAPGAGKPCYATDLMMKLAQRRARRRTSVVVVLNFGVLYRS
jgi:hypothetical protein